MNIPSMWFAKDEHGREYIGSCCMEYDYAFRKNNLPAINIVAKCISLDKTLLCRTITGDKKLWGHTGSRLLVRRAIREFAAKREAKIVFFKEV